MGISTCSAGRPGLPDHLSERGAPDLLEFGERHARRVAAGADLDPRVWGNVADHAILQALKEERRIGAGVHLQEKAADCLGE